MRILPWNVGTTDDDIDFRDVMQPPAEKRRELAAVRLQFWLGTCSAGDVGFLREKLVVPAGTVRDAQDPSPLDTG